MPASPEGLHAYLQRSLAIIEATEAALPEAAMEGAVAACTATLGAGRPLLICGNDELTGNSAIWTCPASRSFRAAGEPR